MSIPISGTLYDPYGHVARFADIKFVTLQGSGDVIETSNATFRTDENGTYAMDVQFGRFAVYMRFNGNNGSYNKIQAVTVNSDTIATTLGELLAYTEPLTPEEILIVQSLVNEAIAAKDDAQAAALQAAVDESSAAASAAAAQASATAAANSSALLAPVPLNGGVWASGQQFTAYNQYMIYNGEAYSPLPATTMPYTVGATPNLGFVYQIALNDHSKLANRNAVGAHDAIYSRNFKTVSELKAGIDADGSGIDMSQIVGSKVFWRGYHTESDGGSNWGIVKSGAHTEDGGSIFSIDANTYVEANHQDTVSCRKFGVRADGVISSSPTGTDNTDQIAKWIAYCQDNDLGMYAPNGVYNHRGMTFTKSISLKGERTRGPEFGFLGIIGTVFQFIDLAGDAVVFDSSLSGFNKGIAPKVSDITFLGNRNIIGATAGGGVVLKGDPAPGGETYFIESAVFKDVQVQYASGNAWVIEGTCFSNDWYSCSGSYSGFSGFARRGSGGSPVNNNLHNCFFFENLWWGVFQDGIKMTLNTCNISQNKIGGIKQESGYIILNNCDFESNENVSIELEDSSPSTIIIGGMIHKNPASAAKVGIRLGSGTAGVQIKGMLFANYDNASDKIIESTGGSAAEFDYRLQNVHANAFTSVEMAAIERIPPLDISQRGQVVFTGSGVGTRSAVINLATAYKVGFFISGSVNRLFGVDPTSSGFYVDATTRTLSSITAYVDVDSDVGDVTCEWLTVGR